MKLYYAPLEGITTYTYRTVHAEVFGGVDAYYAPFITPTDNEKLSLKTIRDIVPERNDGINLKIQVLSNTVSSFMKFCDKVRPLGYNEVNVNLGCPSNTVCKKGRGSAFLKDTDMLNRFFEGVFSSSDFKVSVKTRLGFTSPDEFDALMNIYCAYPLSLLIIHPRTREQMYKGSVDSKAFSKAYAKFKGPLCYNGDIKDTCDYNNILDKYPLLDSVMIGRGAVANPAIFREIKGGKHLETQELLNFTDRLIEKYIPLLGSDAYTLHKLKEIWLYMSTNYPQEKKATKAIKKANNLSQLRVAINNLPDLL